MWIKWLLGLHELSKRFEPSDAGDQTDYMALTDKLKPAPIFIERVFTINRPLF